MAEIRLLSASGGQVYGAKRMIDFLLRTITKWLLSLRYHVSIRGLEAVAAKGKKSILFLPNHPALIDPIILAAYLRAPFAPRALADKDQVDRFLIRWLVRRTGVRIIPSMATYGSVARSEIEKVLDKSIEGLKHGENLLLWPGGRAYRSYLEDLGGNSAVERILQQYPDVCVVLVRIKGLWGSSFSWACGRKPKVAKALRKGFFSLLASGIFFAPRRRVTIEFYEPPNLPRTADRNTLNRFLEAYYNTDAQHNTYVPYTIWEKGGPVTLPEASPARLEGAQSSVPPATRQMVLNYLSNLTGISTLQDSDHLARDLGMDSLARTDLTIWLEKEFGFLQADADAMHTVGDCVLAACGDFVYSGPVAMVPVSSRWFSDTGKSRRRSNLSGVAYAKSEALATERRLTIPPGASVPEVFLKQAVHSPSKIIVADQSGGEKSYRDLVIACLLLKPIIENLSGDCVGIMLPASVAADIFYLATLFTGKTPVMVNWTTGPRNLIESLNLANVKHVLTNKGLIDKIASQGIDLSGVRDHFVFVEALARSISRLAKLRAWLTGYVSWASLYNAKVSATAAIIFTSGSETLPKAVPLTHINVLANLCDVLHTVTIRETDRLIGILPPFHSFGLTGTMLLSLCGGIRTVYHPNPMDAGMGGRLIEVYRVTLLIGTPTLLNGIVRASTKEQLSSLRLAVTGAEKCSEKLYTALKQRCSNAVILEGYGVTECSPIISLNDENDPRPLTIGKVLPSLEYLLVESETGKPLTAPLGVPKRSTGILLVRGPSVFSGYLGPTSATPFVSAQGKQWYSTGDLVSVDDDGVLTFCGRLKRFVKLGGEMISLPAIEAVLESCFAGDADKEPILAVEATADDDHPELVLFTTLEIDRESANRRIRQAGLSGLHNIRKVVKLEQIPTLGTGKVDYRALKAFIYSPGLRPGLQA
jgi:acyl-[acyl-carrier-protein]-phospholipid O-acyltransferase/long-chain-fatty-acid--[acyl-carrier-protein] ligase